MNYAVLKYRGSGNLGDAIQTLAMARLLPGKVQSVYRDATVFSPNLQLIVNGWIGTHLLYERSPLCFAGIHICTKRMRHLSWLQQSTFPIGCRDPFTAGYLEANGIPAEFIGCATATFPRYNGKRSGRYAIDAPLAKASLDTNQIPKTMPWRLQCKNALKRLCQIRTAELVYTSRLHIALPCLAFGTPVVITSPGINNRRFTILDALQVPYDREVIVDVSELSANYQKWLSLRLGIATPENLGPK